VTETPTAFVPGDVAERAVCSVGAERFTWADVVLAAHVRGSWAEFIASVRTGVMADAHARVSGRVPAADDLLAATTKFRYDRNLIAGDDLLEWLAKWGVSTAEWRASLRRALARERLTGDPDEREREDLAAQDSVDAAAWPDAVCSGYLERVARQFGADAALAAEAGLPLVGRDAPALLAAFAVAERERSRAVTDEAIEREVAGQRLEWLAVRGARLELPDADMVREAAMCIRTDGRSLGEVASECGAAVHDVDMLMADLDETLSPLVLAAREGELIGPLQHGESWVLMTIDRKVPPSVHDATVRQRARERIIRRVEDRAIGRHLTWHEPL
jgi:hypothetical protein